MRKKRKKPEKRALLLILLIVLGFLFGLGFNVFLQLPDVSNIATRFPFESTEIISSDGQILGSLHKVEYRVITPLSKISNHLKRAIIASEDTRFYQHHGLDFYGIFRALFTNLEQGRIAEGGSTLTQQLARNLFLSPKRTLTRKLSEMLLALQIERKYTKEEILELYLNHVYWGHNAFGAEAASQLYFGKHASDLSLGEAALLAGMVGGPETYSPYRNFKAARERQRFVLSKMVRFGFLPEAEAVLAEQEPIKLSMGKMNKYRYTAPYFMNYVIGLLQNKYGEEIAYKGGLRVHATLDLKMQRIAEECLEKFIKEEGSKYNFSQAALVALDPRTGYIKAMVGGSNFDESEFNRVVQSKRQPGSSFKPFIYTAAIEEGVSPGFILDDSPVSFEVQKDQWCPTGIWQPKNFDKKWRGRVTLREALERSLNIPSIHLLEKVGIDKAVAMARRMGIQSPLTPSLSLTLGTSEMSLLEMVSAYGVLANSGIRVEPTAISTVEGQAGLVLETHPIVENRVLDPNITAVMIDVMKGVLARGTGYKGRLKDREAAAKTGTTEKFRDAWFIGFTPQLVAGVWVGNDDNSPMKKVAEVAVCPRIWKAFMEGALEGEPALAFPAPRGLLRAEICVDSGLLATEDCPKKSVRIDLFWEKDLPKETCNLHTASPSSESEGEGEND